MTAETYTLHLLPSLKAAGERLAHQEGTSLDQLINIALSEKIAALTTAEFLAARAASGRKEAFDRAVRAAPDTQPEAWDRIDQPHTP